MRTSTRSRNNERHLMKIPIGRFPFKFTALAIFALFSAASVLAQARIPISGTKSSGSNSTLTRHDAATASAIRSTTPERRDQLAMQVEKNIEDGQLALEAARKQSNQLDEESRTVLKTAVRDAFTAQRRLHKSLKAAERASANEWERARAELASDYEDYIQAVAQAESIAAGDVDVHPTGQR